MPNAPGRRPDEPSRPASPPPSPAAAARPIVPSSPAGPPERLESHSFADALRAELPGAPAPAAASGPEETYSFAESLGAAAPHKEAASLLEQSARVARTIDPATAARVLRMQFRTGLDEDLIAGNLDEVERDAAEKDFDAAAYRKNSPKVARMLANSPHHRAVVKDPEAVRAIGDLERVFYRINDASRPLSEEERARTIERRFQERRSMARQMSTFDPFGALSEVEDRRTPEAKAADSKALEAEAEKNLRVQIEAEVAKEEAFIAGTEPLGLVESFSGPQAPDLAERAPFSGGALSVIKDGSLMLAAKRIEAGTASDDDMDLILTWGRIADANERRGVDLWGKAGTMLVDSAQFAVEFAGTGGVFKAGKMAAEQFLRGTLKKVLSGGVRGMVRQSAGAIVGAAYQAPAAMATSVLRGTFSRMSPDTEIEAKDGALSVKVVQDSGKTWYASLPPALADAFAETLSERAGAAPGALKGLLPSRWAAVTGKPISAFTQTLRKGGIHGLLSEMGEEQFAKLLKDYISDGPDYALPLTPGGDTAEDLQAQVLAFGALPALGGSVSAFQGRRSRAKALEVQSILQTQGLNVEALEKAGLPPEAIKNVIQLATKDTPRENVFIEVDTLTTLFQGAKDEEGNDKSVRQIMEEVLGSAAEFDRAAVSGRPVRLPTSTFLTHPLLREKREALNQEARFDPNEMNAREAVAFVKEAEAERQKSRDLEAKAEAKLKEREAELEVEAAELSKAQAKEAHDQLVEADILTSIKRDFGGRIYWADSKGERNLEELVKSGVPRNIIADPKKARARKGYATAVDEVAEKYGMTSSELVDAISAANEARVKSGARLVAGDISEEARSAVRARAMGRAVSELSGEPERALERSAGEVHAAVERQLREQGFDQPTSGAYAALFSSFFKASGGRAGQDPIELFSRYGLKIRRSTGPKEKGKRTSFSQDTGRPKLSALHNISEDALAAADKFGGLAVPSIAVVKEGMGLRGFGGITLIGEKSLGDPSQVPVFDADA